MLFCGLWWTWARPSALFGYHYVVASVAALGAIFFRYRRDPCRQRRSRQKRKNKGTWNSINKNGTNWGWLSVHLIALHCQAHNKTFGETQLLPCWVFSICLHHIYESMPLIIQVTRLFSCCVEGISTIYCGREDRENLQCNDYYDACVHVCYEKINESGRWLYTVAVMDKFWYGWWGVRSRICSLNFVMFCLAIKYNAFYVIYGNGWPKL